MCSFLFSLAHLAWSWNLRHYIYAVEVLWKRLHQYFCLVEKNPLLTFHSEALFPPCCVILQGLNVTLCPDNGNVYSFTVNEPRPDSIFCCFTYFLHQWRMSEVCEWRPGRREVLSLVLCLLQFSLSPHMMSCDDDVMWWWSRPLASDYTTRGQ